MQAWGLCPQECGGSLSSTTMQWLRMIKDYVSASFHVSKDDFDLAPFNAVGGLGRFYQLFRDDYEKILDELNEALAA